MVSFREYLDQDKQLTLECKAYMLSIFSFPYPCNHLETLWDSMYSLKEYRKNMSLLLKQHKPDKYNKYPDGFLIMNKVLMFDHLRDIIKYGLLTGFWNPDGYGLPYYLDKPNPDWVNAAMCANVQEKAEQKQIAKLAKQLYEELKDAE